MLRSSHGCKEYKNGNLTIKFDADDLEAAQKDDVLILSDMLSWVDCYFIGETYCLSNYTIGHTIYNSYSDLCYVFDWNLLEALKAGEMVRLYARRPDEADREILESEGY